MNSDVRKIGDYHFFTDETLGEGATASVFLGYKIQQPDISLAVKQIKLDSYLEDEMVKACLQESQILKKLDNKNIVKFYDCYKTANHIYMIYEYCNQGDLEKLRKSGKNEYLSEKQTLVFMRHICNGYRDLRKHKIIHRDLKPANILLNEGEAKIADFGTARHCDPKKKLLMTRGAGTPLYLSPETFSSDSYDEKCDVWSFGIMIYELLYGHTPWNAKSEWELFTNVIPNKELIFPVQPRRSNRMKNLIMNMLVIDPKKRYGWDAVFSELAEFDVNEDLKNTKKSEKKKIKPVIGYLYEDYEWKGNEKEGMGKEGKEAFNTDKYMESTKVKPDPLKKNVIESKYEKDKKLEIAKSLKNEIFFFKNLASFFESLSFLSNYAFHKNILDFHESAYKIINECLSYLEDEFCVNACEKFKILVSQDVLTQKETQKLGKELNEAKKVTQFKPKKGVFINLQNSLKELLTRNAHLFFEEEEILEFPDYDHEFFSLISFSLLLVDAVDPKDVFKEMEGESDYSQMFYKFYDKYEMMEKQELKSEIKNGMVKLKIKK